MAKQRTEFQKEFDGQLTAKFNNVEAVQEFLADAVRNLDEKLKNNFYTNVKFFVKGGTSLKLLANNNEDSQKKNWSDWDTQLIINPTLSKEQWYKTFLEVDKLIRNFIGSNKKDGNSTKSLQLLWQENIWGARRNLLMNDDNPVLIENGEDKIKAGGLKYDEKNFEGDVKLIADQKNTYNTSYNRVLHPLQTFDNAQTVVQPDREPKSESTEVVQPDPATDQSDPVFDNIYPFNQVVADEKAPEQAKSSMTINYVIPDFYLYRMVVAFSLAGYKRDGTKDDKQESPVPLRAELLDISIPRRDTEEAINQWHQLSQQNSIILTTNEPFNNINVPNWEYHVKENITMILEVIEGQSNSAHKIHKRIQRGLEAITAMLSIDPYKNELQKLQDTLAMEYKVQQYLPNTLAKDYKDKLNTKEISKKIYEEAINSINSIKDLESEKVILLWLLKSLDSDYHFGHLMTAVLSTEEEKRNKLLAEKWETFTNYFKEISNKIQDAYNELINDNSNGKKIEEALKKVPPEHQQEYQKFLGSIHLYTKISRLFATELTYEDIESSLRIYRLLWLAILHTPHPHLPLGSIFSSYFAQIKRDPKSFPQSIDYIFPFIGAEFPGNNEFDEILEYYFNHYDELFKNLPNVFYKFKDNILAIIPVADENKNDNLPVIIRHVEQKENIHLNLDSENGCEILALKTIVKKLEDKIACSTNYHVLHWLDKRRKDYQKAMTTFNMQ